MRATLSVICVYLGSCFCPKLYILWGLACTVQNMSGMSLVWARVWDQDRIGSLVQDRCALACPYRWRCDLWMSHCGWACLHIFKGVCMSLSQCVPGPMGPWVYLMPP